MPSSAIFLEQITRRMKIAIVVDDFNDVHVLQQTLDLVNSPIHIFLNALQLVEAPYS